MIAYPKTSPAVDLKNARPGQVGAIETIYQRVRAKEATTSIILPTGYGKTDVMRSSAYLLKHDGIVSVSLLVVQSRYLRRQAVSKKFVDPMLKRYNIQPTFAIPKILQAEIPLLGVKYDINGEFFLSITTQLINSDPGNIIRFADYKKHATGLPLVVFIDEIDTHTDANDWGRSMIMLRDAGIPLVVLTATGIREDGDSVIGFYQSLKSAEIYTKWTYSAGSSADLTLVKENMACRSIYDVSADYEYTFTQAWNEGALCKIDLHTVDIAVSFEKPSGETTPQVMLSTIAGNDHARKAISYAIRRQDVIREVCEVLVERLALKRALSGPFANSAAIVFCANDNGSVVNGHCEQVKAEIEKIAPHLRCVIATSADDTGADVLEDFVENEVGDVLITKQMAGRGLDTGRIKVVADLSPQRTPRGFIQRSNRGTRPWHGLLVCDLIMPADTLAIGLYNDFVEGLGGSASQEDLQVVRQWEQPKEDPKDADKTRVHGAIRGTVYGFMDGQVAPDRLAVLARAREALGEMVMNLTEPELDEKMRYIVDGKSESVPESENTSDTIESLRNDARAFVKDIALTRFRKQHGHPYMRGNREDGALYQPIITRAWADVYDIARVGSGVKLETIKDVELMQHIVDVATRTAGYE